MTEIGRHSRAGSLVFRGFCDCCELANYLTTVTLKQPVGLFSQPALRGKGGLIIQQAQCGRFCLALLSTSPSVVSLFQSHTASYHYMSPDREKRKRSTAFDSRLHVQKYDHDLPAFAPFQQR